MIFLFSTSFTIHGSPRPLRRSENSLEILKYLHGTCRYRFSISLFVNFSIFSMGREGKECPKTCRIFSPINQISAFIYAPLNPLPKFSAQPETERPSTFTALRHVHTRAHAVYIYMHICTESFSDRKFDGSSNNGMDPCVHIPVHKCGILVRVGGTAPLAKV